MIDKVSFYYSHWIWIVTLIAIVLWILLVWKEYSQSGKKRLFFKMVLAFLAIASLALIALKPLIKTEAELGLGVILTHGYENTQLDSLNREYKELKVIKYDPSNSIDRELDSISSAFILGEGLRSFDIWQLDSIPAIYLGGTDVQGVIKTHYKPENSVGDNLIIRGIYNKPKKGIQLFLEGPGGVLLDSVSLTSASQKEGFQLKSSLKVAGNFIFSLVEKDSLGVGLSSDPLPVKVLEKKQLNILLLNSFPTFETKYLKNFLAEMGHQVLVKSRITKGRYAFESYNTEQSSLWTLSKSNLEPIDLLIIDANSLNNLSQNERSALQGSIQEEGLGVFIQPDEGFFTARNFLSSFTFSNDGNIETRVDVWPNIKMEKHPFSFQEKITLQPIQKVKQKIVSAFQQYGSGRIGTSVIQNTYQLVLDGHSFAYKEYWTELINKLSKKDNPLVFWEATNQLAFIDEPFHFEIRTSQNNPVVTKDGNIIPLRRDVDILNKWTGITYPREKGWNQLSLKADSTAVYQYFVTDTSKWKSLVANQSKELNKRNFNNELKKSAKSVIQKPINRLWFFIVFLMSMGFLWLEPKL